MGHSYGKENSTGKEIREASISRSSELATGVCDSKGSHKDVHAVPS